MLGALVALLLVAGGARAQEGATHPDAVVLDNGTLRVEVMQPEGERRYNRGTRFANIAAVLSVRHQGREYLYNPQKHDPLEDHAGLAAEFDLCVPGGPAGDMPPGYHAAVPGEGFLKIGVGVLRKEEQPYSLFQRSAVIAPARTECDWSAQGAQFTQSAGPVKGYAYELGARIELVQNRLVVHWTLKNSGTKSFITRQYIHNFFRFGDHDSGTGYELLFPYPIAPTGLEEGQDATERSIIFARAIPRWVNISVPYPPDYTGENRLTLRHPVGQEISFQTSRRGIYTAIHARAPYIAPEQFIELKLAPGETAEWTREYEFR